MAGALGCFAFGVGSTDMANAWFTRDVRVRVPESVRVHLRGALRPGVSAKDVMLLLLSQAYFKEGKGIGKVLEFAGDGPRALPRRARHAHQHVRRGRRLHGHHRGRRGGGGLPRAASAGSTPTPCARASCGPTTGPPTRRTFDLDLDALEPMVATPGDPRNGVPSTRCRR
jgi:3-isopropylmalate/(R)-2-methylmalate dehydratase large subunit